ncbi:hypothetical protein SAMN05518849_101580 [Sphingobium sp. AP50]|uniref:hypothetical protein n=1 Tax=Sphingobium sp. AP50 TaxID=1884369 RepID=UPI0008C6DD3F|nr:hypothetical protein [Sphingobium sp. AP50]SEI69347.1 hypothetical protein SAMN05518849_101580 [Sphingobium sp. AP50]
MADTRFVTRMSDEDIASIILSTADAAGHGRAWGLVRVQVVANAVRMGRMIGERAALEPLDDAMRTCVDDELIELVRVNAAGRFGWLDALRRLRGFLDRYPSRGRPDDGGPGTEQAA